MIARSLTGLAIASLTLAPGLPVNAGDTTLIRICSAKGARLIPMINSDENEPQKRRRGKRPPVRFR